MEWGGELCLRSWGQEGRGSPCWLWSSSPSSPCESVGNALSGYPRRTKPNPSLEHDFLWGQVEFEESKPPQALLSLGPCKKFSTQSSL